MQFLSLIPSLAQILNGLILYIQARPKVGLVFGPGLAWSMNTPRCRMKTTCQHFSHVATKLKTVGTGPTSWFQVIKAENNWNRPNCIVHKSVVQVEPGPNPLGPTYELSGQPDPTHCISPQILMGVADCLWEATLL